jgi:hypothetical protein
MEHKILYTLLVGLFLFSLVSVSAQEQWCYDGFNIYKCDALNAYSPTPVNLNKGWNAIAINPLVSAINASISAGDNFFGYSSAVDSYSQDLTFYDGDGNSYNYSQAIEAFELKINVTEDNGPTLENIGRPNDYFMDGLAYWISSNTSLTIEFPNGGTNESYKINELLLNNGTSTLSLSDAVTSGWITAGSQDEAIYAHTSDVNYPWKTVPTDSSYCDIQPDSCVCSDSASSFTGYFILSTQQLALIRSDSSVIKNLNVGWNSFSLPQKMEDKVIALSAGENFIGFSSLKTLPVSSIIISQGETNYTYAQAVNRFEFEINNPSTGDGTLPSVKLNVTSLFYPRQAYWISSNESVNITFPHAQSTDVNDYDLSTVKFYNGTSTVFIADAVTNGWVVGTDDDDAMYYSTMVGDSQVWRNVRDYALNGYASCEEMRDDLANPDLQCGLNSWQGYYIQSSLNTLKLITTEHQTLSNLTIAAKILNITSSISFEPFLLNLDGISLLNETLLADSSLSVVKIVSVDDNLTYHVDSSQISDIDSIYIDLYYDEEPLFIEHFNHAGELVEILTSDNWTYTNGYVRILATMIDEGTGSNLFVPGYTTGYWKNDGGVITLTRGTDYTISGATLTILNNKYRYRTLDITYSWMYATEWGIHRLIVKIIILVTVLIVLSGVIYLFKDYLFNMEGR